LGKMIPEPTVSHVVTKRAFGDTALFTVEYRLSEKFKEITFYALPNGLSWEDASEYEIRKHKMPMRKSTGVLTIPLAKDYYLKVNHDLLVQFILPNGREAAIVQKMDYLLQN